MFSSSEFVKIGTKTPDFGAFHFSCNFSSHGQSSRGKYSADHSGHVLIPLHFWDMAKLHKIFWGCGSISGNAEWKKKLEIWSLSFIFVPELWLNGKLQCLPLYGFLLAGTSSTPNTIFLMILRTIWHEKVSFHRIVVNHKFVYQDLW